ncbi:hypothetical protein [Histidinibacterium aquaticum]|uniref:Uncharacterized protein n=1 Tax=Histidinibacterium aquaticum TaxID=2613962 RepID=A0A5J5GCP0_9RHOB|nr:hypothetical protein [Histidinibacterium aquaticum]KAA9005939.1 hypothetical protein F3S47_15380 [Histidinibacterium aquaticum]
MILRRRLTNLEAETPHSVPEPGEGRRRLAEYLDAVAARSSETRKVLPGPMPVRQPDETATAYLGRVCEELEA